MDANSYDTIANEYRDSKQLDFRKYIEEYTLEQLLGGVTALNILDLACGEGIYTRKLKKRGGLPFWAWTYPLGWLNSHKKQKPKSL